MSEPAKKEGMSPMKLVGFAIAAMLALIFIGIGLEGFMEPTSRAMILWRQIKNEVFTLVFLVIIISVFFGGKKKDDGSH